ncbi:monocarboxylate transporter 12-B-like isoform X3 [Argopecten irradians]|uniref:monocarboxylate transporter 12-B-like isoform X3 n=1 Tax=Argopecten irradians TaxID=31199 RepID=UPI003713FDBE
MKKMEILPKGQEMRGQVFAFCDSTPPEAMQVGDLELDTSGPRGSVYSPPNGGWRPWMIVLACFIINMCNAVVVMLVTVFSRDFAKEFGSEKSSDILEAFNAVRKLGVVVAAILMVPLGYRIVGIIGCGMYGVGLFVSSWLTKDQDDFAAFLLGGLSGLGSSFLLLTAIVPPLEYFSSKRLRAIGIVRAGEILGVIGMTFLYIAPDLDKDIDIEYKWEHNFRYQLIPVGVALLCCITLTPLELKSSDSRTNYVGRIVGIVDWKLFKDLVLYLILILIFMDQFGKPLPINQYNELLDEVEIDDKYAKLVAPVIPYLGELVGLIVMVLCCCWKDREIGTVLILIAIINVVAGILACVAPSLKTFGLVAGFGALFGFSKGIFNSLLDNSVPDTFGKGHVRIVEGLFGLIIGIAELVVSPAEEEILDIEEKDPWKISFYVGGGIVIGSGILAILTRFKKPQDYK